MYKNGKIGKGPNKNEGICDTSMSHMDISSKTSKEIGALGESIAAEYLRRHGFKIEGRNIARKTGELDLVASKEASLHIIEVKTMACDGFPESTDNLDRYDPADNLHPYKIRKVARTAEWYIAEREWEGEWQIDGVLVWIRRKDGIASVRHLPQIV